MSKRLDVYLNDQLVGILEQTQSGKLTFIYDTEYLKTATHSISLSLPLQAKIHDTSTVTSFFSGLLPEESVRTRLTDYLGVSEKNPFAILAEIGGECAGAISIYPHGKAKTIINNDTEILDDEQLKELLTLIKRRPMLAGEDGYRLSLAGAQDKLAVGFQNGQVHLIKGSAPTTHILKPIIEHVKDSVHNELFCMKLAKKMGLDVPNASLHFVDDTPYYIVQRYDRHIDKNGIICRIHQEDFCQALGIPSEIKYEREGGPSIADCQTIITKYTANPAADQIKLLQMIIFNYLIGNADAHGKNFSLLYKNKKPELAPAYDLLCTTAYPNLSQKLAMKIGGRYNPKNITLRHFHRLVPDNKIAQSLINKQLNAMTNKILDTAKSLKTELAMEGITSELFDEIIGVIELRVVSVEIK